MLKKSKNRDYYKKWLQYMQRINRDGSKEVEQKQVERRYVGRHKKTQTAQSYIQRVQRPDGEGFGDCENEKDQKTINFSFHSENQIVGVVITFPEFCSVKLKILDDKKSGS